MLMGKKKMIFTCKRTGLDTLTKPTQNASKTILKLGTLELLDQKARDMPQDIGIGMLSKEDSGHMKKGH